MHGSEAFTHGQATDQTGGEIEMDGNCIMCGEPKKELADGFCSRCSRDAHLRFLEAFNEKRLALFAAETRVRELAKILNSIADRVTNGPLCYYGDHTGYQPQIGSGEVERWRTAAKV